MTNTTTNALQRVRRYLVFSLLLCFAISTASLAADAGTEAEHDELRLSDEVIPMLLEEDLPKRTGPLVELGPDLLGPGVIGHGFELPTGAVWKPSLWIFGAYRTSFNYLDRGESDEILEMPHRLDIFANLQLTGTERLVIGMQPLHEDGRFTNYTFRPEDTDGWHSELNAELTTFFFEGDFGEIFPKLDKADSRALDFGFSIGRQSIEFQDGIMFNDQIDSIGITRNSMTMPGVSNVRTTFLFGWNEIHRDNNIEDNDALLFGLFTEMDTRLSTIEIDFAYISSDSEESGGDGFYWGLGATQRFGFINSTFRLNGSHALDDETAAVSDGVLAFAELSTSLRGTHDIIYCNFFYGFDQYSSAARAPTAGGPLGKTGLLFAAVGLGRFRPALGNRADDSYGAAIGYQKFWDSDLTQLVIEAGGRRSTEEGPQTIALGARLQRKLARRFLIQADTYISKPEDGNSTFGLRTELQVKF